MNDEFKKFLAVLHYVENGDFYEKRYKNNYKITVHKNTLKINYGNDISLGRETTSNLGHQNETKVVFECVDKLLSLGYSPANIVLEKAYPSGRGNVYLDILVKDKYDNPFLMIECKTNDEYYLEREKMLQNGGQLFSYFNADRNAKYLSLYTSTLSSNQDYFDYNCGIIYTKDIYGANKHELYEVWNKTFEKGGIFEDECIPYSIEFKGLKKKQLKPFSDYDINIKKREGTIFNRFSEILRRNSISDKNNAYNKIFNLFLCKIVDEEERTDDEFMWFQWRECESPEEVLSRLNDLYKDGMDKYLKLDITDFSEDELKKLLDGDDDLNKLEITNMFRKLRLYKNNEFAFNEVINERTFNENAKVVKEVVKMLEEYQIKYSSKHQFLGDFFEKLLSMGVKQEAGQFFTPIPITTYIVNSIPIENIIKKKISNRDDHFMPYIIDYACGSGHFLTEGMHRIDKLFKLMNTDELTTQPQKRNYEMWKNDYMWASEFVYGIELDYRLTKTTKVACFLNGDGEANIYYANGLDSFNSSNYNKKLFSNDKLNEQFDVVVANPPYSVNGFSKNLNNFKNDFLLSAYVPDKSDDIETIFLERTYQLLKEGGVAGIVLPDTLLISSTPKLFIETRKFILKHFRIVGITHLGEQTFIKTGTTTIVLFVEKRSKNKIIFAETKAKQIINNLSIGKEFDRTEFNRYFNDSYGNDLNGYISMLQKIDSFRENETLNLSIHILNENSDVVITKTGKKTEELEFLGYKHTDMKRYEGINPYPNNPENKIISKLYNEDDINDTNKASYYVYNNFINNNIHDILKNSQLKDNINIIPLNDLIVYSEKFDDESQFMILTRKIEKIPCSNNYPLEPIITFLGTNGSIDGGGLAPKPNYFIGDFEKTNVFIRAKHLNNLEGNYIKLKPDNFFQLDDNARTLFKKGTIVFPKSGQSTNTNNIAMAPCDCYIVNHLATIYVEDNLLRDYLFYLLKHYKTSNLKLSDTGYPTIRISTIKKMLIPKLEDSDLKEMVLKLNLINRNSLSKQKIFEEEKSILKHFKLIY